MDEDPLVLFIFSPNNIFVGSSTLGGVGYLVNQNPDTNEQKQPEESFHEIEERYRVFFEESRDAIIIVDRDGKIIAANQAYQDLLGYAKEELLQKNVVEFYINPSDRAYFQQEIEQKGSVKDYEIQLRKKDGTEFSCLLTSTVRRAADGSVIGYQGILREMTESKTADEELSIGEWMSSGEWMGKLTDYIHDVIERKHADEELSIGEWMSSSEWMTKLTDYTENLERLVEERTLELKESEERYRGLYESSKDGIISVDMDGKLTVCNQAFAEMLDYTKEELYQLTYWDLISEHWHETQAKIVNEQVLTRGYSDEYEIEGIKKDKTIFPVSLRVWLIRDKDGEPTGMWSMVRDITERKQAEQEIMKLNEDLQSRAVELESLNKELESFSYSVSHDLRAPLRSISGFSQALLEDYLEKIDADGQDYLQRVRAASIRMGELIDALLGLSRITRSEIHREFTDLSEIAKEFLNELQEEEPERQVEINITPKLVADCDPRLLRAVLQNLISNAWKFTGKKPIAKIEFGALKRDGETAYFVRDNGAGFDKAYSDKLFGAFQRLHSTEDFKGIGIGLATVKRIIHRHGGSVWAEGEVEKGATFYFTL
jgi:PAS domain S-box-containing protein